jgi:type II secretory pathway predicted ATPase ExeA
VSAQHYADWERIEDFSAQPDASKLAELSTSSTVFYTAPVVASPGVLERQIEKQRDKVRRIAIDAQRKVEDAETQRLLRIANDLRDRILNPEGYRSTEADDAEDAYLKQLHRRASTGWLVPDPTSLLLIDEADRLRMAGLEQVRAIFDAGKIGLILIGMPGLEKRLARYAQFYSRIGFVHEFRPMDAKEIRQLLDKRWVPAGVKLPPQPWAEDAIAAIIRITNGNFRLLNRLLTQTERILEVNGLREITKAVVETARETLVIGEA